MQLLRIGICAKARKVFGKPALNAFDCYNVFLLINLITSSWSLNQKSAIVARCRILSLIGLCVKSFILIHYELRSVEKRQSLRGLKNLITGRTTTTLVALGDPFPGPTEPVSSDDNDKVSATNVS